MQSRVTDILDSHATTYSIDRCLHAVPPHAVYAVSLDGRRAVCKLACGPAADPATEARVLQHVDRETSVPVPSVLAVEDDYFLAEYHDGAPGGPDGEATISEIGRKTARRMGEGLARLHTQTGFDAYGPFEADGTRLAVVPAERWSEALQTLVGDCERFLEPYGYAAVAGAVRERLADRPGLVDAAGTPVLVHGNYLREHVGISDGRVQCVIDFEHACSGAGEYDYLATAIPTFENPDRSVEDGGRQAFRQGYESVRSLPAGFDRREPVYRAVLGVTYLRSLYCQRQWASRSAADRRAALFESAIRERLDSLRG